MAVPVTSEVDIVAIEWDVRIERAFTLESVRSATESVLAELLGLDNALAVSATESDTPERRGAELAPERMAAAHGPFPGETEHVSFHLDGIDATVWVLIAETEIEEQYADEDDEDVWPHWCSVECQRDPESVVLGIATIIAVARVAGRKVWDEVRQLGLERISDPEDLVRALRVSGAPDLESAVRAVLARTGITFGER
ncbi:hypothetical protein [Actinomadura sp. 3N508]|uniref:hypothetical protein n=1 Tax=Actinomadura sp. 3N508 TaxID=3375153 RepID=UPI003795B240